MHLHYLLELNWGKPCDYFGGCKQHQTNVSFRVVSTICNLMIGKKFLCRLNSVAGWGITAFFGGWSFWSVRSRRLCPFCHSNIIIWWEIYIWMKWINEALLLLCLLCQVSGWNMLHYFLLIVAFFDLSGILLHICLFFLCPHPKRMEQHLCELPTGLMSEWCMYVAIKNSRCISLNSVCYL